jgi:hypothetical protein
MINNNIKKLKVLLASGDGWDEKELSLVEFQKLITTDYNYAKNNQFLVRHDSGFHRKPPFYTYTKNRRSENTINLYYLYE